MSSDIVLTGHAGLHRDTDTSQLESIADGLDAYIDPSDMMTQDDVNGRRTSHLLCAIFRLYENTYGDRAGRELLTGLRVPWREVGRTVGQGASEEG